nr:RNA-directed DNA polymerase, eukaryota, reverse transcriptase zinc-binding domain protein [Tanacetum cinerariifolium]
MKCSNGVRLKKQALIFKVDFEKAYDSVRWDFLDEDCLKSSRGSVIINGSPTEEFQFGKGIKQGDPLSPFLFLLIMESLHLSFQRVVDAGLFQGLQLGGSVNLSHMFIADDAVFVGQWSEGNINSLVNILECFNMASGLKINMRKSKIMGVRVTRDKVDKATTKLVALSLRLLFYILDLWLAGQCPDLNHGVSKDSSLWAKVIMAIHGSDGKVKASMKAGTRSCWMNILHEVNVLSKKGIDLKKFIRFKVGNRENIMFWEDTWKKGGKFKCRFPRMYALESCKSITVGRKLVQFSLIDSFRRSPRGGAEQQQYNDLEDMVTATILAPMSDRLVWSLESSREFMVASVRKLIDDKLIMRWWDVPEAELESYAGWLDWARSSSNSFGLAAGSSVDTKVKSIGSRRWKGKDDNLWLS